MILEKGTGSLLLPLLAAIGLPHILPVRAIAGDPAPLPVPVPVRVVNPVTAALPRQPGTVATNEPAIRPEDARLQEFLKLTFDRSARSVLQSLARQADGNAGLTNELKRFQADVISGRWEDVGSFLKGMPEDHRLQAYKHLLNQLQRVPQQGQPPGMPMPEGEMPPGMITFQGGPQGLQMQPVLMPEDVLALADQSPVDINEELADSLGKLLARALSRGNSLQPLVERLDKGTARLGGEKAERRELAARVLIAANRLTDAGRFLPSLEDALTKGDTRALDLHARYQMSMGAQRDQPGAGSALLKAWELTQTVLASTNAAAREREQSLSRALELMPSLSGSQGTNWLRESFELRPALGMNLLATVGGMVQQGQMNRDTEARARNLELQQRVVAALLETQAQPAAAWRTALNVLALAWVHEADQSRMRWQPPRSPGQQFDQFGNPVYFDGQYYNPGMQDPNQIPPIAPDRLLALAPHGPWLASLEPTLAPRIVALQAGLQVKTEEESKALAFIESIAGSQPKLASDLTGDLLRSWSRNHSPNQGGPSYPQRYYNPYGVQMMQGLSLTRAHQVRNIKELAGLLGRLRGLPGVKLDERLVVSAFTEAHSNAEVFRVEDIEAVFGSIDSLPADTMSELCQAMRSRLAGQWRQPRVQQDVKTRRTDKEIEAEVQRGYELLTRLIQGAIDRTPGSWRLRAARGAALFDWAEFDYGKKVDLAVYTSKRDEAFASFRHAAGLYAAAVPRLPEGEQSPAVHQQWFNSLLGASDLAYLTRQQEPATNHLDEIRAALLGLPGEASNRHMAAFGKGLGDAVNQLRPDLKPRYLRAGLRVVGNHASADDARRIVQYYDDLLGEILLDVRVDGDPVVGHREPFGVFVSIRYSLAVGRESGGFTRYLQNQGNQAYYNPYGGSGPVNYRDNFEKQVREKFSEAFEILAVAFHDEKVEARGVPSRPGWRETPYAYLLLKAKDASADRLPPLQIDMDFMDRRGQVVLPVASLAQWIDARPDRAPRRPVEAIEITQVLDDRPSAQGHVTLELKSAGHGLLPGIRELVDLAVPGFTLDSFAEPALSLAKLDTEGDAVAPISERNVVLTLRASQEGRMPELFRFPGPRLPSAKVGYKRYEDADVVEVKGDVALAGIRLSRAPWWRWPLVLCLIAIGVAGLRLWRRRHPAGEALRAPAYTVPTQVTPFTVLALLRRMHADRTLALDDARRVALGELILGLERGHFSKAGGAPAGNLEELARDWVRTAGGS